MRDRVFEYDAAAWARDFVTDLAERPPCRPPDAVGLTDAAHRFADALARGRRVALFLDYDGTLREIERDPAAARPNDAVVALLDRLRGRTNLDVTIISGRTPRDLESFLGGYPPFGLIAEHGATGI